MRKLWTPRPMRTRAITDAETEAERTAGPRLRRLPVRVRLLEGDDVPPGSFECIASQYDVEYDIGWGWTEIIRPGAFADSIAAHPVIPVFWQHAWTLGPIGMARPEERPDHLHAVGQLYLDMGDLVQRVYQGMKDEALEEWSVGYYEDEILETKDMPHCDQIMKGDLAEISNVVRGANPETETVDLRTRRRRAEEQEAAEHEAEQRTLDRLKTPAGRALLKGSV